MDNWNFDKAVAYIDTIQDPISRGLTRLFLDAAVVHAAKRVSRPEADFDLLFFAAVVSQVSVNELGLIHSILAGEQIDTGWETLADALGPNASGQPDS